MKASNRKRASTSTFAAYFGIRIGVIALTKSDLAEPDVRGLAELEVEDLVRGSFLEGAPIIEVSAKTGAGLDALKRFPSLLRLAELLESHADYRVRVEGYTDGIGSASYNDRLGLARATQVRDFLVKYGARTGQFELISRGKTSPKAPRREAGLPEDRRSALHEPPRGADGDGRARAHGRSRWRR